MTPSHSTAIEIAEQVRSGRTRAIDVCEAALARIAALDARLGAFLELTPDAAREQARHVDERISRGELAGALAGVPIALKDNICTSFSRTTCGSRILAEYRPPVSATAVEKLAAAGAVIVGKTNLDEFAMGSSTENSALRRTCNPWDSQCVPGGSSGGSAAAVAARLTPLALGSDTGGSVRQPAALCGVVGLKPTYGRVSRSGLVAYGSSLDQIGPLATTVADAALLLGVIAGRDPRDSTSADRPSENYLAALEAGALERRIGGLRIGLPREYLADGLDAEVRDAVDAAIGVYRRLGAAVVDVSLPHTPHSIAAYYLIATAECSSNLARYDGVHYGHRTRESRDIVALYSGSRGEGLGAEVKRRLMLGTFALSAGYHDAYYEKALRVRRLIQQDFERALELCDMLACPTSPTPAFRFGEKTDDPLTMYLADVYTIAVNLAGLPAISIPCGFARSGLPIGLQLIGGQFAESGLLAAARLYERETEWSARIPSAFR